MSLTGQEEILLNAYLDGELPPADAAAFERRLESEPRLVAELDARRAVRDLLRSGLDEDAPPAGLERRIMAGSRPPSSVRSRAWRSLAASFLVGGLLGGALGYGVWTQQAADDLAGEIVSAHIRALMAPQPADVASSDHHTVKPWFAGKLAFAPRVVDLKDQGFPLVGGRIDVIGMQPVASLVYTNGKHLISVMEMPAGQGPAAPLASRDERGYLALSWTDGDVTYWAVSDMASEELNNFVKTLRAAKS